MTTTPAIKLKLSAFMFLQYFTWGAWYVSLGTYLAVRLKFDGGEIGAAYGAFAIGSMVSPFFVGLIADRYFASEKLLAALGVAGAVALFALSRLRDFASFYPVLIAYCALFAPTLALISSLSLHHLADAKRDYPRVKIFGSVGWIAGGVALSLLHGEQTQTQFLLASAASLVFGGFALLLPHTPPRKTGREVGWGEILGFDALGLLKQPSFAVFVVCMFLICIPLYFYFVLMSIYVGELQWSHLAGKMALAQISDVIFLALLAVMLRRLGYKKTIFLGILAWAVRYFLLAQSVTAGGLQAALIFAAILLHGVCYDFLFIAGQLYVDAKSTSRNRGAAQGFIAFILWGVGALVGTFLAGKVLAGHRLAAGSGALLHDWQGIWMIPAVGAAGVMVVFLICFREPIHGQGSPL